MRADEIAADKEQLLSPYSVKNTNMSNHRCTHRVIWWIVGPLVLTPVLCMCSFMKLRLDRVLRLELGEQELDQVGLPYLALLWDILTCRQILDFCRTVAPFLSAKEDRWKVTVYMDSSKCRRRRPWLFCRLQSPQALYLSMIPSTKASGRRPTRLTGQAGGTCSCGARRAPSRSLGLTSIYHPLYYPQYFVCNSYTCSYSHSVSAF